MERTARISAPTHTLRTRCARASLLRLKSARSVVGLGGFRLRYAPAWIHQGDNDFMRFARAKIMKVRYVERLNEKLKALKGYEATK